MCLYSHHKGAYDIFVDQEGRVVYRCKAADT